MTTRYDEILAAAKALVAAERASLKAAERRGALPPGSSRARVTTANADWARKAEHRDRLAARLGEAVAAAHIPLPTDTRRDTP